ncbi:chemotaxis response regulator protein-glutamate methylesterase [Bdellovibrionota bacterium FG-2]
MIPAHALTPITAKSPEVIRAAISSGAIIAVFDLERKVGGVLCIPADGASQSESLIQKLLSDLGTGTSPLNAKIVGDPSLLNQIRKTLTRARAKIVGEKEELIFPIEAYFYVETGRLRIAEAPSTPKIVAARRKIRVLIVDDSKTIQQLLTKILSTDEELEIVGVADRPSVAEKMIRENKPDVITLDINMPEMDGVSFLKKLLPTYPIPTVMISSISKDESTAVFDALECGAVDYIQKPSFEEITTVAPLIIEKVKTAASIKVMPRTLQDTKTSHYATPPERLKNTGITDFSTLVAMGASTGGTEALREVLIRLPKEIPPILIVQHIPPVFSAAFANRLNSLCEFEVKEAEDGDEVKPGRVLIAPGGLQMSYKANRGGTPVVVVKDGERVNRHKPSVDVLFHSVAQEVGKKSIGILLTGMGADGAKGLLEMKTTGAPTIAQDEATSVVFGMPREAIQIGGADFIEPLPLVAKKLLDLLQKK